MRLMEQGTQTHDEVSDQLDALARDECYRVEMVLGSSSVEVTERVWYRGANGSELGPFVRKRVNRAGKTGEAWRRVWEAQRAGARFRLLPRLVDCHDAGEDLVVVAEWVEGITLRHLVEHACEEDRPALARSLVPLACEAVREMHERFAPPLIHRDLTPSNLVVAENGSAVTVIDLGIARSYDPGARQDTVRLGTRPYAPPEQYGFGQTDVRADVYALGMVLRFCLEGRDPEPGSALEVDGAGVPRRLAEVVRRATAFDPSERYGSVAEMEAAISGREPSIASEHAASGASCGASTLPGTSAPSALPGRAAAPVAPASAPRLITARNVLVAVTLAFFLVVSLTCAFQPERYLTNYPRWYGVFCYIVLMPCLFVVIAFGLMDKRWLIRHVPALHGWSGRATAKFVTRAVVALFVAFFLAALAATR